MLFRSVSQSRYFEPIFTPGSAASISASNSSSFFKDISLDIKTSITTACKVDPIRLTAINAELYASAVAEDQGDSLIMYRAPIPEHVTPIYSYFNAINQISLNSSMFPVVVNEPILTDTTITAGLSQKTATFFYAANCHPYTGTTGIAGAVARHFYYSDKEFRTVTLHARQLDYAVFAQHVAATLAINVPSISGAVVWQIILYFFACIWNNTNSAFRAAHGMSLSVGGYNPPFSQPYATPGFKVKGMKGVRLPANIAMIVNSFSKPYAHGPIIYVPMYTPQSAGASNVFWAIAATAGANWPLNAYGQQPISWTTGGIVVGVPTPPYPDYQNVVVGTNYLNEVPYLIQKSISSWKSVTLYANGLDRVNHLGYKLLSLLVGRQPAGQSSTFDTKFSWSTFSGFKLFSEEVRFPRESNIMAVLGHVYYMHDQQVGVAAVSKHEADIATDPSTLSSIAASANPAPGSTQAQKVGNAEDPTDELTKDIANEVKGVCPNKEKEVPKKHQGIVVTDGIHSHNPEIREAAMKELDRLKNGAKKVTGKVEQGIKTADTLVQGVMKLIPSA